MRRRCCCKKKDDEEDDPCCKEEGGKPTANFTYKQTSDYPCCFDFTSTSTPGHCGSITTYLWDFGNGVTSSSENPQYCYDENYPAGGPWNVTLTVTDEKQCTDSITKEVACEDICDCETSGPNADFSYRQTSHNPCCITFTDESLAGGCGPIVEYYWEFGDGETSTEQHPSHCYDTVGPYQVVLRVTDSQGCEDAVIMTVQCFQPYPRCCNCFPSQLPGSIDVTLFNVVGCTWYNQTYNVPLQPFSEQYGYCSYYKRFFIDEVHGWLDVRVTLNNLDITVTFLPQYSFSSAVFTTPCIANCAAINVSNIKVVENPMPVPGPAGWGCTGTLDPRVNLRAK